MNKHDKQYEIRQQQACDTQTADAWLAQQGINPRLLNDTHGKLIQALQQANQLIEQFSHLLSKSQLHTLTTFQQQMRDKQTRRRLKPSAAYPVLNISSKVNRQLFSKHRHLHHTH